MGPRGPAGPPGKAGSDVRQCLIRNLSIFKHTKISHWLKHDKHQISEIPKSYHQSFLINLMVLYSTPPLGSTKTLVQTLVSLQGEAGKPGKAGERGPAGPQVCWLQLLQTLEWHLTFGWWKLETGLIPDDDILCLKSRELVDSPEPPDFLESKGTE